MRDFGLDDWPLGQPTQALCVYNVSQVTSTASSTTTTTAPAIIVSNTGNTQGVSGISWQSYGIIFLFVQKIILEKNNQKRKEY